MSKERFIITGARRTSSEFSMDNLADSFQAVMYEVDFDSEQIIRSYTEDRPVEDIYPDGYSMSFRGCTLTDEAIYTCTHSEILKIDRDTFTLLDRWSLSVFNDIHHVDFIDNKMVVASTGLDHVGFIENHEAEMVSVLPVDESLQLSNDTDYRKISTKPHKAHPNYVFELEGRIWVTRFIQKDAICLDEPSLRMAIDTGTPHDGLVVNGKVYFTTVNGAVIVFDSKSLEKIAEHDLQVLYKNPLAGWCRGIEVLGDTAYVGFTRIRKTRSIENLGFITDKWAQMVATVKKSTPARVLKYDLKSRNIIKEMSFKNSELSVIFSIKSIT